MDNQKIAIVTGANRGIGFEICRQLGRAGFKVILTARNTQKGNDAAQQLVSEGLDIVFEPLEVGNEESTIQFAQRIKANYPVLDVLVNNAGILPNTNNIEHVQIDELKQVFDTNFFGPAMLIQNLLPLLKKSKDARIINLSTGMGAFNEMGAGYTAYRTSKTALNSLTAVVAKDLAGTNIKINSMCPGWVRSDMGGAGAPRSLEKGADTALWLATEPTIKSGGFYRDRKSINW
jgi:NAD(P)-dependent dehydrogenase (short-subunit alcohol dehydrogenase family)